MSREQRKRRAGNFDETQGNVGARKSAFSNVVSIAKFRPTRPSHLARFAASLEARSNIFQQPDASDFVRLHRQRLTIINKNANRLKEIAGQSSSKSQFGSATSLSKQRKAAFVANETTHLSRAINALHDTSPQYSSKKTFTPAQAIFFCLLIAATIGGWLSGIQYFSHTVLFLLSAFYLASVFCRLILLSGYGDKSVGPTTEELAKIVQDDLPRYSVVVALHREANQVQSLCFHLSRLNWPKDRLEIKLICEADDIETILAIKKQNLPAYFDLITVPYAEPRTKPKALNYALPLCSGKYLVLYDAEDQPDPDQLLEAHYKFQNSDPALVCLQAPLHIHNREQTWLTRMFAIEYCTQFEGILPILERWKMPIPLGGTSNHFKLVELKSLGAWDPYNVTEDADLGIRLCRAGYKCGTITRPTHEEAPPIFSVWLPQRTRWIKGWMQTILVHSRSPGLIIKQMGWKPFVMFHLLITSVVLSSLAHPFFLYATISQFSTHMGEMHDYLGATSMLSAIFVLVGGYVTYGLLAYLVLGHNKLKHFRPYLFTLPLYWLLISIAGLS